MRKWPRHPVIYEINTWVWLGELSRKYRKSLDLVTVAVIGWSMLLVTMLASCVKSETGISTAALGIEGPEWQLVEVSGSPVSIRSGQSGEPHRPFVRFDGDKKQAAGFSGCNSFFGSYELSGSSLKFGLIGATRMFCEGEAGEMEMSFMAAMNKTRAWNIRDGVLLFLDDSEVLARFMLARGDDPSPDLRSMTFMSTWFPSGKVTLSDGEYREPAAPGSASETVVKLSDKRAFGLIDRRDTGAVVLVTSAGGTGTFYDLALLIKEPGGWVNRDVAFLGDRVKVHSLEVKDNHFVITMTTHGPGDAMCCPTLEVEKFFAVEGNRLVPVAGDTRKKEHKSQGRKLWAKGLYFMKTG